TGRRAGGACAPSARRRLAWFVSHRNGRIIASMVRKLITVDPQIHGGMPVFRGTRVPVKNLFDYLEAGESLDQFLDDFPTVAREVAVAVLEQAREAVTRMRILLDESLPRRLGSIVAGNDVATTSCLCGPDPNWVAT